MLTPQQCRCTDNSTDSRKGRRICCVPFVFRSQKSELGNMFFPSYCAPVVKQINYLNYKACKNQIKCGPNLGILESVKSGIIILIMKPFILMKMLKTVMVLQNVKCYSWDCLFHSKHKGHFGPLTCAVCPIFPVANPTSSSS